MQIQELDKNFNFHDSCITKIDYNQTTERLDIYMDFCNWDQSWYKDSDPELVRAKLTFEGITAYNNLQGDIDYFSIGNAELKGEKYYLFIEDDFNNESHEIFLTPSSASFVILGPVEESGIR